tara:strand:- start:241 stop:615 length:375 start_codon:yes stop_codon:yes gene_type:complete
MDYINEYVTTEEVSITSSGTAEQKLYAGFGKKKPNNNNPNIELKRLFICNTDSTDITVNLWLDDEINEYYLLKGLTIKQGTTLDFNDGIPYIFDNRYSLKLNLGDAGHTADITTVFCIKNYKDE